MLQGKNHIKVVSRNPKFFSKCLLSLIFQELSTGNKFCPLYFAKYPVLSLIDCPLLKKNVYLIHASCVCARMQLFVVECQLPPPVSRAYTFFVPTLVVLFFIFSPIVFVRLHFIARWASDNKIQDLSPILLLFLY